MARFYGVYLQSTPTSSILDVIRFLGEPDSIRFSHITLRGPYSGSGLTKHQLKKINYKLPYPRSITLMAPDVFFSDQQSTVVLRVDLGELNEAVHKPDFPDAVPHLTIYDGKSRSFALEMQKILSYYDWRGRFRVGPLSPVVKRVRIDQEFVPLFSMFCTYFRELVGPVEMVNEVQTWSEAARLSKITSILKGCTHRFVCEYREFDGNWMATDVTTGINV